MTFHNAPTNIPDPEVVPKAKRRKFSAEYKWRMLEEADNCTEASRWTRNRTPPFNPLSNVHSPTWRKPRSTSFTLVSPRAVIDLMSAPIYLSDRPGLMADFV